ncbi:MAG: 7-cyano-7-deazaguanine synthase [Candidatus Gracilibacteria bacterium]|nr:7-cyano-7-deazaguanine synthase [Candidatus Gracilibacteria bacterium]
MKKLTYHENAVILLSGGLDSAVVLSKIRQDCKNIFGLFFNYGQKTNEKELNCATALAEHYRLEVLKVIDIKFLAELTKAALCDRNADVNAGNEYVPFRNGLFLSIATALAESVEADVIYIGSTGGDQICKDNSSAFRSAFEGAIREGTNTEKTIQVVAPLANLDKSGVVRKGFQLGTPFEITWSCHNAEGSPCGTCSNCQSRQKAFNEIHEKDPAIQ